MEAIKIETKIGPVLLNPTSAVHIYVTAESHVTVRGVEYRVSTHFHLWADGQWRIGQETKNSYERRCELYVTRISYKSHSQMDASEPARKTIEEVLTAAVNQWAANGSSTLFDAESARLQDELDKATTEKASAKEAYEKSIAAEILAAKKHADHKASNSLAEVR